MCVQVRLWDVASGTARFLSSSRRCASAVPVTQVAWSPSGERLVTAGADYMLRVWDARAGTCLHEMKGHRHVVTVAAWSPDGTRLLSASEDSTLHVWTAADWLPYKLPVRSEVTSALCYSCSFIPVTAMVFKIFLTDLCNSHKDCELQ